MPYYLIQKNVKGWDWWGGCNKWNQSESKRSSPHRKINVKWITWIRQSSFFKIIVNCRYEKIIIMKKLIYFFLVFGLFACSSDSADDDNNNSSDNSLLVSKIIMEYPSFNDYEEMT